VPPQPATENAARAPGPWCLCRGACKGGGFQPRLLTGGGAFEESRVMRTWGLHRDWLERDPRSSSSSKIMWYGMWYGVGGRESYYLLTGIYLIVRRTPHPPTPVIYQIVMHSELNMPTHLPPLQMLCRTYEGFRARSRRRGRYPLGGETVNLIVMAPHMTANEAFNQRLAAPWRLVASRQRRMERLQCPRAPKFI
jgi:hypothetical protein